MLRVRPRTGYIVDVSYSMVYLFFFFFFFFLVKAQRDMDCESSMKDLYRNIFGNNAKTNDFLNV